MDNHSQQPSLRLYASSHEWFEGKAMDELRHVLRLEGMRHAAAFPDMHPGLDSPNGAAFISEGVLYPHLIGNDIGCGYALYKTDLHSRKLKLERATQRLHGLDQPWEGDARAWLAARDLPPTPHDNALGTIGGGNHFAELQQVQDVTDAEAFQSAGLDKHRLLVLVHSGSRGLGQSILRAHTDAFCTAPLRSGSAEAAAYMLAHDHALCWAKANRERIASRFAAQLNTGLHAILDLPHNCVTQIDIEGKAHFLHRKGASPAGSGIAVIPGSRGALTYLVRPLLNTWENAYSIAHGAGRRWDRHATEARLRERFRKETLLQTELGGRVICEDKALLFQEAPQAYKDIAKVIQFMVDAGLIQVIATLRPLITYKKRNSR